MDLCVLPQTGASEQWLMLVVAAVVVIGAGVALAVSGKARRRVATGLGALAIVGALAIGGVAAAPAAQADAGTNCVTAPAGAPAPAADVVVTPGIPGYAQQCNAEAIVTTPTTTGVTYTPTRDGQTLTLTATANPGYRILAGATTTWTYDLTPQTVAVSPVALPLGERVDYIGAAVVENGEADEFSAAGDELALVLQGGVNAGLPLTYSLSSSAAALAYTFDLVDADGAALPSQTVSVPVAGVTFTYDFDRGSYLVSVPVGTDAAALFDQLDALAEAFFAENPGVAPVGARQEMVGLSVDVAWGQGTVCGTQTDSVPVNAVYQEFGDAGAAAPIDGSGLVSDSLPSIVASAGADEAPAAEQVEAPVVDEAPATEAPATEAPATEAPATEETAPVEG